MYDILYPSITICGDDGFGEFVVVLYPHVRNVWKIVSRPLPAAFVFASCQLLFVLLKAMLVCVLSGSGTIGSSGSDCEQENRESPNRGNIRMRCFCMSSCFF